MSSVLNALGSKAESGVGAQNAAETAERVNFQDSIKKPKISTNVDFTCGVSTDNSLENWQCQEINSRELLN